MEKIENGSYMVKNWKKCISRPLLASLIQRMGIEYGKEANKYGVSKSIEYEEFY